jgi:hypothetical protein
MGSDLIIRDAFDRDAFPAEFFGPAHAMPSIRDPVLAIDLDFVIEAAPGHIQTEGFELGIVIGPTGHAIEGGMDRQG